jgi:hypothetical protein
MIALPLSILALAAGVYLLIKVNREYLGGIFKFFAWLIIVLSLLCTVAVVRHGIHHYRMMKMHRFEIMHNGFGRGMQNYGGACCGPAAIGANCCKDSAACPMMSGCKMVGDSVVLNRAACEKMMGKEACYKLCKERGQCIMTMDECAKMCGGMMKPGGDGKACCMGAADDKGGKACCKK